MNVKGNGILFSPPELRHGIVYRGVISVEDVQTTLPRLDRDLWVFIQCRHHVAAPPKHPLIDMYQCDRFFASYCGKIPYVLAIPRDFTDPNEYRPIPDATKSYDIIYNATWLPVKRHKLMFEALDYAKKHGRPITCLAYGYHWHSSSKQVEQQLKSLAVNMNIPIDFVETDWSPEENNRRYNMCRVALLCSRSEAGPRVMAEAMLAGLPYITTSDTYGGSVTYITPENGERVAASPKAIAEKIWVTLDRLDSYKPRPWALENMCRPVANARLTKALIQLSDVNQWPINIIDWDYRGGTPSGWFERALLAERSLLTQHNHA